MTKSRLPAFSAIFVSKLLLSLGVALPGVALAQTTGGGQAGSIVRDQARVAEPLSERKPPVRVEGPLPKAASDEALAFDVRQLAVTGVTVLDPATVEALSAPFIGKTASLADLNRLARALTAAYAERGYGFAFVYVPEQTVADGVVRLQAIETRLGKVEVRVNGRGLFQPASQMRAMVESRIAALNTDDPLRSDMLERVLLLLGDLDGLTAEATLAPSATINGASDIIVTVTADAAQGSLAFDNYLRADFGRYVASPSVVLASLATPGDSLALNVRVGLDDAALALGSATYSVPIGGSGLTVFVSGTVARTHASSGLLSTLDFAGREESVSLGVRYPIIRSRSRNLSIDATLDGLNSSSRLLGTTLVSDRIRTFSTGVSYDWADSAGGRSLVRVGVAQGIDGLGASSRFNPLASRIFGSPQTTSVSARGFTDRPIGPVNLRLDVQGEYTLDGAKLAPVECSYGGQRFGLGYFSGALGGDHCLLGNARLSYPLRPGDGFQITPFVFGDYGLLGQAGGLDVGETRTQRGASAGAGITAFLPYGLTATATVAQPLITSPANPSRAARPFVSVGKRF